ncbi:MAG: protein-L-isoaspartate(D-aspartate) O-methyltransferase [Sulfurimonas sp.]
MEKYFKPAISIILLYGTFLYAGAMERQYDIARKEMVETVKEEIRGTSGYPGIRKLDQKVIDTMAGVKRHLFVPAAHRYHAYRNRPLPIGYGQTISQPYMVAVMTDLLKLKDTDIVLEVGTGSGYQAAVLARIVKKVYTMEIIEPLGLEAKERLEKLGYDNIEVLIGDGYYGLESKAPFDAVIVTAAAGQIPPPLLKQLKPEGRMVIPVGSHFFVQHLVLVAKDENGEISIRQIMPVAFVPLTGEH